MAGVLKGLTLQKNARKDHIAISWKQGSVMGFGGDRSQSYNVYEYIGPNGSPVPVFIQSDWDIPENITIDSRVQYGMNEGVLFLVLHDKSQTPYQHRFMKNFTQKALYAANALIKSRTGGIVDASWIAGDYLRDF